MHISGNNFWGGRGDPEESSYLFSKYTLSWGWATWRRAWQKYDFDMKFWFAMKPQKQKAFLQNWLSDQHAANTWVKIFQNIRNVDLDCWDYQWTLTCWLQGGVSILPPINLVSNVGFGADATHTFSTDGFSVEPLVLSAATKSMAFPLRHPNCIICDSDIDQSIQDGYFDYFPKIQKRIQLKLKRIVRKGLVELFKLLP
jgi:hypothetical protein